MVGIRWPFPLAALLGLLAVTPAIASGKAAHAGDDIVNQVEGLVQTRFFDAGRVKNFELGLDAYQKSTGAHYVYEDAIKSGLARLNASHTDLYTPEDLEYYELLDIFYPALSQHDSGHLKEIFPTDGLPKYEGIGIVTSHSADGWYISDIYDSSPAAKTSLAVGDLILDINGRPFAPIESFKGKAGQIVTLTIARSKNGAATRIPVKVSMIRPNAMTDASIGASIKTFDTQEAKVGYLHLWTYSTPDVQEIVQNLLSSQALQNVDGLILDMRCRHGGAPPEAGETFIGITPELDMVGRSTRFTANFRYRKPLVGLIDGGTRSGMEILAYSLKKAGVLLVGTRTAGAVLGGSPFLLKDGSLLYLAVMNGTVDGHPLEGIGVSPTFTVAYDKLYSHGHDPQLQEALLQMQKAIKKNHRPG